MARPALNPGLLGRPAREGARAVALQYLRHALEEAARLSVRAGERSGSALCQESGTEDDAEAVHDFRVALRRLRSWLQAFRSFLDDTVTQRSERRLKRLSRQAGAARDLQVQRVILCELTGDSLVTLEARRIAGLLARDEARARKRLIQATLERLPPTAGDLAEQLHRGSVAALPAPGHTMALVMARLLAAALERVETALPRVKQAGQVVAAHEARIAIKQLRYLLECLGRSSRLAAAAASSLATLQNALGQLHDVQVLTRSLVEYGATRGLPVRLRRAKLEVFRRTLPVIRSSELDVARSATSRLIRRLERMR